MKYVVNTIDVKMYNFVVMKYLAKMLNVRELTQKKGGSKSRTFRIIAWQERLYFLRMIYYLLR